MNITIINDSKLEDKEYFTVSLERGSGVNSRFELADLERNISVTDMDGNTVLSLPSNSGYGVVQDYAYNYCDVHVWEI